MVSKKNRGTILVVDDNPTNIEILLDYLQENEYRILVTRDGQSAIKRAFNVKPDLILLDIMMPGLNGFEVCKYLKNESETKSIPIIFMTALADINSKLKGFELGAVDYITKPFQKTEVFARIQTHLTIQEQKKKLAQLNASKDRFFSIVSHDMKGAFGSLLSFTQYVSKSFDTWSRDDLKRLIYEMSSSAKKNYKLLENFLEWSKTQMGATPFQPSEVLIEYIIVQAIQVFQEQADAKNIKINYDFDLEHYIQGDPQMLATIFRNLISNAIKFSHSGGTVNVSCKEMEERLEISIVDNGCGIEPEMMDHLFCLDKKCHSIGTAGEKGTGLGLLLCKDLLEKHSGNIYVTSKKGYGTTFVIDLPKSIEPQK